MKTFLTGLGLAIIITVPLVLWNDHANKRKVGATELDARIKAYAQAKAENDSLQVKYDAVIETLIDSIAVLNEQIQQSELLLTEIKNKRNEKITRINKLTTDELSRAITNNYKERIAE
jgi:Fe2+ transport system protein B